MNGLKAAEIIGLIEQARDNLIENNGDVDAAEFRGGVRATAKILRTIRRKVEAAGGLEVVDAELETEPPSEPPSDFIPDTIESVERRHILRTVEFCEGVKMKAAKLLGIERSTLDRKLRRFKATQPT